jgi:Domain of unknown function (DUF4401)
MTLSELSGALASRGMLAEGQELAIDPGPEGNASPWYVQVMLGVCAWFAGLFLLTFLVLILFEVLFRGHDNWSALLVISLCVCGGAVFLYATVSENSVFGNQFALAMSCASQIGMAFGLGGSMDTRAALWGMMLVQIGLVFAIRNRLHRVLMSTGAVIMWALATHEFLFSEMPGVSLFRSRTQESYDTSAMSIALWLVVWAPVANGAWWLVKHEGDWMAGGREKLMRPVTYGVVGALSIASLATHPASFWMAMGLGSSRELSDGATGVTALWPLLAMFLALLGLALAFSIRNGPLMGLAIVFALLEISSFYYVLGTTLLVKSMVMAVLGIALLASAHWLAREAE